MRVLVVEDEPLISMEVAAMLEERGVVVIGPANSVGAAHRLIAQTPHMQAALLDMNVGGDPIDSVTEALEGRGVPYAFMTGYDTQPNVAPVIGKPFTPEQVFNVLRSLTKS